jgi:hypothetical protein
MREVTALGTFDDNQMTGVERCFGERLGRVLVRAEARNQAHGNPRGRTGRPSASRCVALAEWSDADRRSGSVFITRGIARQAEAAVWQAARAAA